MNSRARLGKYQVWEMLGKGAMGVVYKGFDPLIERVVALKTLRADLSDEHPAGQGARFQNEAKAAGRLNHPGIVAVYEFGEDQGAAFIAMEYVEGKSLREFFVSRVQVPLIDAVSIMAQILSALAYAHQRGVIHRDIKPGNIIVMNDGRLKVADFGIARLEASDLTQVGSVMGTPSYMSPEQFLGRTADRRSDLFSAGILFYELLTGAKPFVGTAESVAYKICNEAAPAPSLANALLPPAFDVVVARALAKNPDERFQSAHEFREAIQEAYEADPSPSVSEQTIRTVVAVSPPRSADPAASQHSEPSSRSPSGERSATPAGWQGDTLSTIEGELAPFVGPVARVLVRRAAHRTQRLDELVQIVAENLGSDEERRVFLQRTGSSGRYRAPDAGNAAPAAASATPDSGLTPETVERAAGELAAFVGPIAKVLARKAAQNAGGRRALYLSLADKLATEEERRRFLAGAGFSPP